MHNRAVHVPHACLGPTANKTTADVFAAAASRLEEYASETVMLERQEAPHHTLMQLLRGESDILTVAGTARLRMFLFALLFAGMHYSAVLFSALCRVLACGACLWRV